ncbi:hypothetical protein [Neochlamydia sp. S13]|uniref:hypothetical protein n=1 Tax=Neochlamydia sp. S13 TaxID=1353976 RepID=UPI0005A6F69E|nr:hypothetical protein [Neochlamydia sp. S13]BBI16560.1 hypothetical protein NCS13_1_0365 [Neochlamydia sp. S13]
MDEVINEIDAEEEVEGRTLALNLLSQVAEGTLTPFEATSHLKDHILKIFERIKNDQFKWKAGLKKQILLNGVIEAMGGTQKSNKPKPFRLLKIFWNEGTLNPYKPDLKCN